MKKLFAIVAVLMLVVLCATLLPARAQAVDVSELTFTLNEDGESYSLTACPKTAVGELIIPDTYEGKPVTAIGKAACRDCTGLTKVVIPESVQSIGNAAFSYCTRLVSINIPEGITEIGGDMFFKCYKLASITIPESVVSIAPYAFYYCKSLTEVTIPDRVFNIGEFAFANCLKLTSVKLPADLMKVSKSAFQSCKELRSVIIPDGVTSIEESAFNNCLLLFSVGIPDSVTSIGAYAFDHFDYLQFVYYCGTDEQWSQIAMAEGNENLQKASRTSHQFGGGDCETAQTCAICGEIGPNGHKWVPATCTEPQHCSVCQGTVQSALGHSWVDATCAKPQHCARCEVTEGEALPHTYDDDKDHLCNVCGFARTLNATDLVYLQAPSLSFQDYIGMQVLIDSKLSKSYSEIYVEAVQIDPEKGAVTTRLEGFLYYYDMFLVFDQQILSWSMAEEVTLTLYGVKNGVTYVGASYTASVEDLALAMLNAYKTSNAKLCRVLVDMLNYGAAVQTNYNHNASLLPNTQLAEYADLGTVETPEMTASAKQEGTGSVAVMQTSVSMQSKVEVQMLFVADVSAYTPKAVLNGQELQPMMDTESMGAYGYTILRLAVGAANMRDEITIALYDADGNAVTAVCTVSVEALAKGMVNGANGTVAVAMMRYGDAVAAYAG